MTAKYCMLTFFYAFFHWISLVMIDDFRKVMIEKQTSQHDMGIPVSIVWLRKKNNGSKSWWWIFIGIPYILCVLFSMESIFFCFETHGIPIWMEVFDDIKKRTNTTTTNNDIRTNTANNEKYSCKSEKI